LFACSEAEVLSYPIANERQFFHQVLAHSRQARSRSSKFCG
jgi:hypothetical protein